MKRYAVISIAVSLGLLLSACGGAKPVPLPQAAGPEYTFLVLADTHYGCAMWENNEAANKAVIDELNALPGAPYPEGSTPGMVSAPLAAIVVGDLTDSGEWLNWHGYWLMGRHDGFEDDYGFQGEGRLRYPILEAYGNHDIAKDRGVVVNAIRQRNAHRAGIRRSANGLHYSWDWGAVHYVNLNLYPGGPGDARDSLPFLKEDLAACVGDSGRPVVLFHHYGFDSFSCEDRWWTETGREAYYDAIKEYNIAAIFNGHLHNQSRRTWHGIEAFTAGRAGERCYLVVRVTNDTMTITGRDGDTWRVLATLPLTKKNAET